MLALCCVFSVRHELTAGGGCDDVGDGIEEEEFRVGRDLDEHDDAGSDYCQQSDDVHNADTVEDDVAWAVEVLGRERHICGLGGGRRVSGSFELGGEGLNTAALKWKIE